MTLVFRLKGSKNPDLVRAALPTIEVAEEFAVRVAVSLLRATRPLHTISLS